MGQASDRDVEERLLNGFKWNNTKANVENSDEVLDDVLDEDIDVFDLAPAIKGDGRDV